MAHTFPTDPIEEDKYVWEGVIDSLINVAKTGQILLRKIKKL